MVQLDQPSKNKKLTGAVDAWYGRPVNGKVAEDDSEYLADLAKYGVDVPAEAPTTTIVDSDYEVWPEHWTVVTLFLRCATQWRATSNGILGLDYGPVLALLAYYPDVDPLTVVDDLRIMEQHALKLFQDAQEKARKAENQKAKRNGRRR